MLGLTLNKLKVAVQTNDGVYGVELPFKKGLNIIRAENTSGKSTCINAIAYALGLEDLLGPSRKKPFPNAVSSDLKSLKSDDAKVLFVKHSHVTLEISNQFDEKAILTRDIKGHEDKITVTQNGNDVDYFLGSAGTVGSAKSEHGFHYWLERFIGWKLPTLTTYDGNLRKLYLQCVFPLFFIEQKRGWSEIQANTPTHYGIKNIKKSALEYVLGLEDYDKQNRMSELTVELKNYEGEWDKNQAAVASLGEFTNTHVRVCFALQDADINESPFEFYVENINTETELKAYITGLKINLKDIHDQIISWPYSKELEHKLISLREVERKLLSIKQAQEAEIISLTKVEGKLQQIKRDLDKYKQLKRLSDVGSEKHQEFCTERCPICDSNLHESLIEQTHEISPLSVEQNIDYLNNQSKFYDGIKNKHLTNIDAYKKSISEFESRLFVVSQEVETLTKDEEDFINRLTNSSEIRRKLDLENRIKQLEKINTQLERYNKRAVEIHNDWHISKGALDIVKKEVERSVSSKIIEGLEIALKSNLNRFGFDKRSLNYVKISSQTLRPELDGYDIVADSSASDYIRIIWSYTLALLELGVGFDAVKHGGFVVFDEPRQHEANKESFKNLLEKSSSMVDIGGQIIIATSIGKDDLLSFKLNNKVNVRVFEDGDYILQKIN